MAVTLSNVNSEAGLQKLDDHLLTRSYISGYQASKDDMAVYTALSSAPPSSYVNVTRWFDHISALLRFSGVTAEGEGVKVESSACSVASTPDVADQKAPEADEDDDDDVDLFGEETEEEKKAAEERAAAVKAAGKKKESGKSSVLLDVKPWDDETDMTKLEEAVRSVKMEGLLWGASKLAPVGYGIKKLQIMMTIVDDLVSVDSLIEDYLYTEPANEYIQSCDIVAFNKICKLPQHAWQFSFWISKVMCYGFAWSKQNVFLVKCSNILNLHGFIKSVLDWTGFDLWLAGCYSAIVSSPVTIWLGTDLMH